MIELLWACHMTRGFSCLNLHPGRLTWNLRIHPWKRKIIFQTIIFRFYVNLRVCRFPWNSRGVPETPPLPMGHAFFHGESFSARLEGDPGDPVSRQSLGTTGGSLPTLVWETSGWDLLEAQIHHIIYIDISYYTNIRWIHDKCMCMYIYLYVNIYIHMIFWCMRVLHVQRICAGCVAYRYTYTHIEKQIKDNHIRSYDIYYHDILQNIFPSAKEPSKNLALSKKSQPATKNDMFCICRCFRK